MEQKTERRFFNGSTAQITRNDDGEAKHISGTGIVFYNADEPGTEYQLWENVFERIDSNAIDRALAEGDDVRGLFNHDSNMLLGRTSAGTMVLEKTDRGIDYTITPGNTTVHQNVQEHIERGDLTGSSFAFTVDSDTWERLEDGTEIRTITGVTLYDIGPVTFPAYEATSAGLRTDQDFTEARASYDAWRAEEQRKAEQHTAETAREERRAKAVKDMTILIADHKLRN